jgi:hypothetical protein
MASPAGDRTQGVAHENASPDASLDEVTQFLLTSAANDFHTHGPADRLRFREVRLGHSTARNGQVQYMLCGQFQPAHGGATAGEWMSFTTIKTSGYEQYIGAQAESFSNGRAVVWNKQGDLSSALQSRVDALR